MTDSKTDPDPSVQTGQTSAVRPDNGEAEEFGGHGRLDTLQITRSVFSEVFELDLPIIRTLIDLTIRPGKACRDYIEGSRRKYTNPVKYCVLITAVYVLVLVFFDVDLPGGNMTGSGTQEAINGANAFQVEVNAFLRTNMNLLILASLPGSALVMRVIFRKSRLNYAENLVFLMFLTAQTILFKLPFAPFEVMSNVGVLVLLNVAGFAYFVWAASVFYQLPLWGAIWRSLVSQVLFMIITALLAIIATILFVFIPYITEHGLPAPASG